MTQEQAISKDIYRMAAQCRHYAMCKIDYLGTGLCPPAEAYPFVSYFPQGRMDLYCALNDGVVPMTQGAVDIIESCTFCGRCDRQCHFTTGLRPMLVMAALKKFLDDYRKSGKDPEKPEEDQPLTALRRIVGSRWATNDPALLVAYADDPFPLAQLQMPRYVVMPRDREEVVRIVDTANRFGLPTVVRGNGGSVFGFVFTDGVVLDLNRMKGIDIDADNWTVTVEPGVTSFELQTAVTSRAFRVNTAEPAATVCGNIVCTGLFSTWANVYGVGADGIVDMEFVDRNGHPFLINHKTTPNCFAFEHAVIPSPGICTKAVVKMHPTTEDEDGLFVPFSTFSEAVSFATELSRRRIGLAVGVLGGHYLSTFMSPSSTLAERVKDIFSNVLGIAYVVFVIGDRFARETIDKMTPHIIDSRLFRALLLGLPRLDNPELKALIMGLEGNDPPYAYLFGNETLPVMEATLSSRPETLAEATPSDLREFYVELYSQPHMTDLVWLNMFRIISARMSRHKHMFAFLVYVPGDRLEIVEQIIDHFVRIAERHDISHDYGFLTPIDLGKRAILEYDYYIDHTDSQEGKKIEKAMQELEPTLDRMSAEVKGVTWLKYIFSQGCARKEGYLYEQKAPSGR